MDNQASTQVDEIIAHIERCVDNDTLQSFVSDALALVKAGEMSIDSYVEIDTAAAKQRKFLDSVGDKKRLLPRHCRVLTSYAKTTTDDTGRKVTKMTDLRVPQLAPAGDGREVAPATVARMAAWWTCAPEVVAAIIEHDLLPEDSGLPAQWARAMRKAADMLDEFDELLG